MTSDRKIAANQRNSRRSTGPRNVSGKIRVSRNALKHGFAALVVQDPGISAEVERLASALCNKDSDQSDREQALIIAECEFTLMRIRAARVDILDRIPMGLKTASAASGRITNRKSTRVSVSADDVHLFIDQAKTNRCYFEQLRKLDRYERRALSRRKRACRRLSL